MHDNLDLPTTIPSEQNLRPKIESATYSVDDLAMLLQCSPRHIWRQLDLGKIPGVIRIGRLVRLSRRIVDAWIERP